MQTQHPSNKVTLENVDQLFQYQKPTEATIPKYEAINEAAKTLAKAILEQAPDCADRSAAIRWVSLARMQANAAIATAPQEDETGTATSEESAKKSEDQPQDEQGKQDAQGSGNDEQTRDLESKSKSDR